ncbi:MAG TPA: hypothetical protein VH108_00030 [Gaiellaceae bacterium]|jgi:hypothetical protein|nr:hypothetical protein [Gaiellaceae bacterium]
MNASRNTKISALAVTAVALVAVGGAFAAGKHHGSKASAAGGLSIGSYVSTGRTTAHGLGGPGRGPNDDFAAAATYLGLSQSDLQTALQSGKTLAQVADATSGKSAAGLIDALVAHEQTELAAAVTAGRLTQAQANQITATLKDRFTNLVNGTWPPHDGHGGPRSGGDDFAAAATYLGLSQSDLQTALQSGKTLAQVADATSGKSTAGLIDALVAHEQTELAAAVTAGRLTQAQADQITATLKDRFTNFVNGVRPSHAGFGSRHGFGSFRPAGGTHI